jgi:hypothetical protein
MSEPFNPAAGPAAERGEPSSPSGVASASPADARRLALEEARVLLDGARHYVSCDVYSSEPYGAEARALYERICAWGVAHGWREP